MYSLLLNLMSSIIIYFLKVPVEVFAVCLEMAVIRSIFNFIEFDEEENTFKKSIQVVIDM